MKKIFALILAATMLALTLVSCGGRAEFVYADHDLVAEGYVTLGEYKNLELDVLDVTDDEIKSAAVSHLTHDHGDEEEPLEADRACKEGDLVTIDYVGTIDGEEFEGGKADDQSLVIGQGNFIDGFEDGIIGMKKGEKKTIDVTFPEDYSEELAGKAAQFEITLDKVYDESIFLAVETELLTEKITEYTTSKEAVEKQAAWEAILENTTIDKYPEDVVKQLAKDSYNNQIVMFAQYGLTPDQLGYTVEMFEESARAVIKDELTVYAIAQAEGLTVSEEEYNAKLELLAKASSNEEQTITPEEYEKYFTRQSIETKVLYDKVVALAVESSTFTK